jgi:hypothetical protein
MTNTFEELYLNAYDTFVIDNYEFYPEYNAWDRDGFDLFIYIKGSYKMVSA